MNSPPEIQRQAFIDSLSKVIAHSRGENCTSGLLLIDIVNLARINHSKGFLLGDKALDYCYSQLKSISRIDDTLFRCGDHLFAFILPELKTPTFIALAMNKVVNTLKGEISEGDQVTELEVKIGIAVNKNSHIDVDKIIVVAEQSLKRSKSERGAFDLSQINSPPETTDYLEQEFKETLKANGFELFYQPQINMRTGIADHAEALLRWNLPDAGFISPEVAIDLADKTGQSFALTKWVMQTAVRQIHQWQQQGLFVAIAVNVQADLIQDPELFNLVQDSLAIWGVDKKFLTVEITESAVIGDKEAGFDNLSKLKDFGVNLSIDDFGTGYSSLSYFNHIPANELKIDQSFVFTMLSEKQDREIVKIIIDIAQLFGLKIVAEGIENQPTYDLLKELGCDYGQGFHMAKPMPADKFVEFMQQKKTF